MTLTVYKAYIDPTGENIMTPDALAFYLAARSPKNLSIPDFCPPEEFDLTLSELGYNYAAIEWQGMTRYYFLTYADPANETTDTVNYHFRIDFPHTLRMGDSAMVFSGASRLFRGTTMTNGTYPQARGRLLKTTPSFPAFGWRFVYVFNYAVTASTTVYTGEAGVRAVIVDGISDNDPVHYNELFSIAQRILSTQYIADNAGAETSARQAISPVMLYLIPGEVFDIPVSSMTGADANYLFTSDSGTAALKCSSRIATRYQSRAWGKHITKPDRVFEVGTINNRLSIPNTARGYMTIQLKSELVVDGANLSIKVFCGGECIDITSDCVFPFIVANRSELSRLMFQKYASITTGVVQTVGAGAALVGGIATLNVPSIGAGISGLASGASQLAAQFLPQGATPTIKSAGNFFSALDGFAYDDSANPNTSSGYTESMGLRIFEYEMTPAIAEENKRKGAEGAEAFTGISASSEKDFEYYLADVHFGSYSASSGALIRFARMYFDRVRARFAEGVRIWTKNYLEV